MLSILRGVPRWRPLPARLNVIHSRGRLGSWHGSACASPSLVKQPALKTLGGWRMKAPQGTAPTLCFSCRVTRNFRLLARREPGEFVLTVEEPEFVLVLAMVVAAGDEVEGEIEALCIVHSDGDALVALRWARGFSRRMRQVEGRAKARAALDCPWSAAVPAKC